MKDKLQVLSGAMMIPVILLVVAGVFIGLGSAFVKYGKRFCIRA